MKEFWQSVSGVSLNAIWNNHEDEIYGEITIMTPQHIQYVSDENGNTVSVIVPIELWHEIESERETAYLLQSEEMKERLLRAKNRSDGLTLEEVSEKLDLRP